MVHPTPQPSPLHCFEFEVWIVLASLSPASPSSASRSPCLMIPSVLVTSLAPRWAIRCRRRVPIAVFMPIPIRLRSQSEYVSGQGTYARNGFLFASLVGMKRMTDDGATPSASGVRALESTA